MKLTPQDCRVRKKSLRIAGHRTSVALESIFWTRLEHIAAARGQSLPALIAEIDTQREMVPSTSLASAIRVWLLLSTAEDCDGLDMVGP